MLILCENFSFTQMMKTSILQSNPDVGPNADSRRSLVERMRPLLEVG